jgi:glycerol-3-phosphate O-acyltransferase/dihydroxyacetone phosphate acyltransferase
VEYGKPVNIPSEYVEMYKQGGEAKRKAIGDLLDRTAAALKSVTVNAPDYDTLKVVQTARRLLRPTNRQLSEHENLELTRRLMTSYLTYKDHPVHKAMMARLLQFHNKLETYNVRDHQLIDFSLGVGGIQTLRVLIFRSLELFTMLMFSIPGSFLLLPPMILIRRYANEKARKAKAASTVKLTGQDVISTVS